jgi:hypothetical protein
MTARLLGWLLTPGSCYFDLIAATAGAGAAGASAATEASSRSRISSSLAPTPPQVRSAVLTGNERTRRCPRAGRT